MIIKCLQKFAFFLFLVSFAVTLSACGDSDAKIIEKVQKGTYEYENKLFGKIQQLPIGETLEKNKRLQNMTWSVINNEDKVSIVEVKSAFSLSGFDMFSMSSSAYEIFDKKLDRDKVLPIDKFNIRIQYTLNKDNSVELTKVGYELLGEITWLEITENVRSTIYSSLSVANEIFNPSIEALKSL